VKDHTDRLNGEGYRHMRSAVERFSAWLEFFKRKTIRYKRLASAFLAFIQLAYIMIYMRVLQWVQS
jgi:transposase